MKDRELIENVRDFETNIKMETNAGKKEITKKGIMPKFGQAYYDKDAMTNLVSLNDAVRNGTVFLWTRMLITASL